MSGFKYARVLNIPGFSICQCSKLNFQGYKGFSHFRKFDRALNMRRDAIMKRFLIFQNSEYADFLNIQALHEILNMPEYG